MSETPLLFDVHLDLSLNAMQLNRDLRLPVENIRQLEKETDAASWVGRGTVAFPDMRRGNVGLCVATQIARAARVLKNPVASHGCPEIAWAMTKAQLAWYREMERQGHLMQITTSEELHEVADAWKAGAREKTPIGYVLSLEGGDSLVTLDHLHTAYGYGLRLLGPAHYGPGVYAPGTGETGGLTARGRDLLTEMDRLKMILDVTHLTDEGFDEALEQFKGPIWASHSNCRAIVPDQRQQSDSQIKRLIERGAPIGMAFDAWMMVPNWIRGESQPDEMGVKIETIVDHIDHICQLAGNANHVMIGSDLDGGFGTEQGPADLDTIADLQTLLALLSERGYSAKDIACIMHGNALAFLTKHLPN